MLLYSARRVRLKNTYTLYALLRRGTHTVGGIVWLVCLRILRRDACSRRVARARARTLPRVVQKTLCPSMSMSAFLSFLLVFLHSLPASAANCVNCASGTSGSYMYMSECQWLESDGLNWQSKV